MLRQWNFYGIFLYYINIQPLGDGALASERYGNVRMQPHGCDAAI